MPERLVIATGTVTLEAIGAGAGGRPLLLVHGFGGAKEDFADHLDALAAAGWHAVAPDLRGHGRSDHPRGAENYSLAIFAADMLDAAGVLGWDRFTLLGHSMGGMVAQLMAIDAGHRLDGLILMDTAHAAPDGLDPAAVELAQAVVAEGGMQLLVRVQASEGIDPLATPAHRRLVAERPGYDEFGQSKTLAASPDMWQAVVAEIVGDRDTLPHLAALAVPALVIQGEQDTPFLAHGERMAKAIPGARLVIIPDAGHSPQFENPTAFITAVREFLAGL